MTLRTKGEQKAYLDGYEMCAECIENYLTGEGKQILECLLMAVRTAVGIEDLEQEPKTGIRECGSCKYSKDGHMAGTEECHDCMWESKQEPYEDYIGRAEAMTEIMMFAGNVRSDEGDIYIKVSDAVQLLRELPPVKPNEPKTTDKTIQAILDFLENNNSEWGQIEWKDKNGKGFETDQGYFIQGLQGFRDYLKESEGAI